MFHFLGKGAVVTGGLIDEGSCENDWVGRTDLLVGRGGW